MQWIEALTVAKQLEKSNFLDMEGLSERKTIENLAIVL